MKKLQRLWWKIYRDRKGKYRCSCRAPNGRKVWASSQGYARKWGAVWNACLEGDAPMSLTKQKLGIERKCVLP